MGTCGSKCCFTSPTPSISEPGSPDDKAVIFSDPDLLPLTTPPPSNDPFSENPKNHYKIQIHSSPPIPPASSSSSTTPTSSSISSSTTTTSTTTASYSSFSYSTGNSFDSRPNHSDLPRPLLRKKSFSNEFLLSCVENSNIVILDPTRSGTKEKLVQNPISKISEIPVTTSMQHLTASSLRQHTSMQNSNNQLSNNAKRARSVSPASRTGRKVIKPDAGSWNLASSNITRPRTGELPPPQWRPVNSQRGSSNILSGPVSRPVSAAKRDLKGPTMDKEVTERKIQDGEVISRDGVRTPPLVEDLNNPLIAMDCFIFL